jgi:hypothetical protein
MLMVVFGSFRTGSDLTVRIAFAPYSRSTCIVTSLANEKITKFQTVIGRVYDSNDHREFREHHRMPEWCVCTGASLQQVPR